MKMAIKALLALLLVIPTVSDTLAVAENKNNPEIKTHNNYIAIFDFEVTTGDNGIARPLADSVIHEFSKSNKYEIIDRGNINKILKDHKFQISGCVPQDCKIEAGQILGVAKIVYGSVSKVGKTYYLTLQLIDVQAGKIELSVDEKCRCKIDELLDSTKRLAKKLLDEKVESLVGTKPKQSTSAIDPAINSLKIVVRDGRFEKLASGVVRDTKSGLEWYAGPDKDTSWDDTKGWVDNLRVDGGGWRMPTRAELKGLYQKRAGSRNMTALLETTGWWVWSGETGHPPDSKRIGSGYSWSLDFDYGSELLDYQENSKYKRGFAVRSVR
jgi:TolB-like protein